MSGSFDDAQVGDEVTVQFEDGRRVVIDVVTSRTPDTLTFVTTGPTPETVTIQR